MSRDDEQATLSISYVPLAGASVKAGGMLLFRESAHEVPLPPAWRSLLTPRERDVGAAVLRGWDNRIIASELGCAVATVKRHLQNIFDKLGVSSRALFMARAARFRRD